MDHLHSLKIQFFRLLIWSFFIGCYAYLIYRSSFRKLDKINKIICIFYFFIYPKLFENFFPLSLFDKAISYWLICLIDLSISF